MKKKKLKKKKQTNNEFLSRVWTRYEHKKNLSHSRKYIEKKNNTCRYMEFYSIKFK